MEIRYLCRAARECFCHLAGACDCRYMQILSEQVRAASRMASLSGVCRSRPPPTAPAPQTPVEEEAPGTSEPDTIRARRGAGRPRRGEMAIEKRTSYNENNNTKKERERKRWRKLLQHRKLKFYAKYDCIALHFWFYCVYCFKGIWNSTDAILQARHGPGGQLVQG